MAFFHHSFFPSASRSAPQGALPAAAQARRWRRRAAPAAPTRSGCVLAKRQAPRWQSHLRSPAPTGSVLHVCASELSEPCRPLSRQRPRPPPGWSSAKSVRSSPWLELPAPASRRVDRNMGTSPQSSRHAALVIVDAHGALQWALPGLRYPGRGGGPVSRSLRNSRTQNSCIGGGCLH